MRISLDNIREHIVGWDKKVPLATGGTRRYVYLDNAASTPALAPVRDKVNELIGWYSSIHRGTGFKSAVATHAYERARQVILDLVGAGENDYIAVFSSNTTEALNKLACSLGYPEDPVVLVSPLEHHSNDLPWRRYAELAYLPISAGGVVDLAATRRLVESLADRLALIAVTGASNVTGLLVPVHELAKIAHANGVRILVDGAQLAPHLPLSVDPGEPGAHLDYVVIAGHKMYAPYGGAALIGRRDALEACGPACRGGGTVKLVTRDDVVWADMPDRLEPGTPNFVGAVAMAVAAKTLETLGYDAIRRRENEMTKRLLEGLLAVPGITIYGSSDTTALDGRLGVVSFNLDGIPHQLVAAVLAFEGGIGVRNGCFCAQPYVAELLGLGREEFARLAGEMLTDGDRRRIPGMVRASLGIYNDEEDVDHFLAELARLAEKGPRLDYTQDTATGAFHPEGYAPDLDRHFVL
ncbi:MAG TPA: aminotransferase class V-fold PLP-dependent enzyme [bacterium]|nr:aminotransferase class V-fold PLP-dependent enzyme [bacterium]